MNNIPNDNENDYLIFCNELKAQYEVLDKEKKIIEKENILLKKEILSIYGILRVLDSSITDLYNIPNFVVELIERTRGALSYVVETYILKIKEEEEEEEEIVVHMVFDEN